MPQPAGLAYPSPPWLGTAERDAKHKSVALTLVPQASGGKLGRAHSTIGNAPKASRLISSVNAVLLWAKKLRDGPRRILSHSKPGQISMT